MQKHKQLAIIALTILGIALFGVGGWWLGPAASVRPPQTGNDAPTQEPQAGNSGVAPPAPPPPNAAPLQPPAARSPVSLEGKEVTLDLADKVPLKLVRIPPGKFLMGSPITEPDRMDTETQHQVTISKAFYMGVTHVTVDQFAAFVKDSSYATDAERAGRSLHFMPETGEATFQFRAGLNWHNPGFPQTGSHPAVHITWNDAQAFCAWLAQKSGVSVRLPTQAQWEYACRAGTTTVYPWGDSPEAGKGWANVADASMHEKFLPLHGLNWTFVNFDDGYMYTSPVASFKPNAFGLYDMIGNAYQWCQDVFVPYTPEPQTDPEGTGNGPHVARGGSWGAGPRNCRPAMRVRERVDMSMSDLGFRVVAAVD